MRSRFEFIALMALLMSLTALTIDAMLPALEMMASDLNLANRNNAQWIVSFIFLGMSVGLMFFGPFSDTFGRKNGIYLGIGIYFIGTFVCLLSENFNMMLLGRLLQGFGCASTRVLSVAIIRDKFEGNDMAQMMSLIMIIFVLVPILAPALGQIVLYFATWHWIFILFILIALISVIWFALRQEETLKEENKRDFSLSQVWVGIKETWSHGVSRNYTIASGLIFGAFFTYLNLSQQIFQGAYTTGEKFSLYFAILAFFIGLSSYLNSKLVHLLGMKTLIHYSLFVMSIISIIYSTLLWYLEGNATLLLFMIYMAICFLCIGILFGNFNALALSPLGHIAGIANSVISALQTLISALLATWIGNYYSGDVVLLPMSFCVLGVMSLILIFYTERTEKIRMKEFT